VEEMLPQAAVGAQPGAANGDTDSEEDDDEPPAEDDSCYFKHPALNKLPKDALKLFVEIVVKVLGLALGRHDEGPVNDRALKALYNLPGAVRDLEYSAVGSARNRRRHVVTVLEGVASSTTLLRSVENLHAKMKERRGRMYLRSIYRGQKGLEERWDDVCGRVAVW
jgi:hypothetical protein